MKSLLSVYPLANDLQCNVFVSRYEIDIDLQATFCTQEILESEYIYKTTFNLLFESLGFVIA